METIGSRIGVLSQDSLSEELESLERVVERAQKKTPFDVRNVILTDLEGDTALDINRKTKVVRMDRTLAASNDDNFKVHGLIHEGVHHKFETKSGGVAIMDNDINEAATEVVAGEESRQGPQTYDLERLKLKKLETTSGENIVQLFKEGKATKINEIIAANDENYA